MYDPVRLAALVAVAEAGSITRAAERLGYTPPALSQQLAKLERRRVPLFSYGITAARGSPVRVSCWWRGPAGCWTSWTGPGMNSPG